MLVDQPPDSVVGTSRFAWMALLAVLASTITGCMDEEPQRESITVVVEATPQRDECLRLPDKPTSPALERLSAEIDQRPADLFTFNLTVPEAEALATELAQLQETQLGETSSSIVVEHDGRCYDVAMSPAHR